jgi:hypothetical protein
MAKTIKLGKRMRSLVETLEIMADRKLFKQILRAAETLKGDARQGKLHNFEEVFGNRSPSSRRRHRR